MSLYLSKPIYRCDPIRSVPALARALRLDVDALFSAANTANKNYRIVPLKPGSTRQTFDAKGHLKEIHRRMKATLFRSVDFPDYLHGSLRGCDYVTNASLHTNKQLLICEDVKKFFPSISAEQVQDVWCGFFGFAPDVAELLTRLTTRHGTLPQGAIPSSYLANLVLWRYEPLLQAKLAKRGITYSRYVDDMAMSSVKHVTKETQTLIIAQVYGMLRQVGLKAGRNKHEIFSATKPMIATKLIVNRKPSLSQKKRSQVRAQVRQVEMAQAAGADPEIVRELANSAARRVGQIGRFHKTQASHLKERVMVVRAALPKQSHSAMTLPMPSFLFPLASSTDDLLPWE
jgi:Reverse transcriptase (RNA-dependent DNA polymerase)